MVLLLEPFKDVQNCKFVHYWTVEKASRKLDTYLGLHLVSVVTDEGSKQEILSRIAQTVGALSKLKTTWKDKDIALSSKIKMMRSLVISIFLYACETWTLTEELERKIQATDMECLRRLLDISYRDHVTNEEVRNNINHAIGPYEDLITTVRKRKLRWCTLAHNKINRTFKDNPTGHGTRRKKRRQTEKNGEIIKVYQNGPD